jgi:hypothetical protein
MNGDLIGSVVVFCVLVIVFAIVLFPVFWIGAHLWGKLRRRK